MDVIACMDMIGCIDALACIDALSGPVLAPRGLNRSTTGRFGQ
jgi:hypothetical protein